MNLIIRMEKPEDDHAIYTLTKAAFAEAEHADGNEQDVARRLRQRDGFNPKLSLVALLDEQIAGHVLFTGLSVGGESALCLAIVSVLPSLQGRGIGSALIRKGHETAKALGFSLCLVLGHETYYPRFGYEPAAEHGIIFPIKAPEACKMVKFFDACGRCVRGTAVFPPEPMEDR